MPGESRFMAVVEVSYPDLIRALALADEIVGNREVDVLDAFCQSDDEAERVRAALRGAFGDIQAAVEDYDTNVKIDRKRAAIQMSTHVTSILLRVIEFGVHLGRLRLMTLEDKPLRARLEALTRARKAAKRHDATG